MVDGLHLATDFHYQQQKLLRNHTHKIILLLNEKFLKYYRNDLPPIPVFNQSLNFDPVREVSINLRKMKKHFDNYFIELINF